MLRALLLSLAAALPTSAQTTFEFGDQYLMGAGQWRCARVLDTFETGTDIDKGQVAGFVLGFWSAANVYSAKFL